MVSVRYIKHYFKFSRVGVNDLSLDETKQYIMKEGIQTDMDAYDGSRDSTRRYLME